MNYTLHNLSFVCALENWVPKIEFAISMENRCLHQCNIHTPRIWIILRSIFVFLQTKYNSVANWYWFKCYECFSCSVPTFVILKVPRYLSWKIILPFLNCLTLSQSRELNCGNKNKNSKAGLFTQKTDWFIYMQNSSVFFYRFIWYQFYFFIFVRSWQ